MSGRGVAGVCLALVLTAAASARAGTRVSMATIGFGFSEDQFAAFDPALGTLLSVDILLIGAFQPTIVSDAGPGQTYIEPLSVSASFTGLFGQGFSTVVAPTFQGSVISSGPGLALSAVTSFQDELVFDSTTDLAGFAADSAGGIYNGRVADFVEGRFGGIIEELATYDAFALGHSGAVLPSAVTGVTGSGFVTYTYTPPAPVPEPSTWATIVVGLGLAGVVLRRRRPAWRD